MEKNIASEFMTAKEVAQLLRVSNKFVYQLAESGKLPCLRIGRIVRFRQDDVMEMIVKASQSAERRYGARGEKVPDVVEFKVSLDDEPEGEGRNDG